MDHLRARGAALEYWFFNFRAGELSFLVDFICRREPTVSAEVRVSRWVRGVGAVVRDVGPPVSGESLVELRSAVIEPGRSAGTVDDTSWDLSWDRGAWGVDPRPRLFGPTHPLDLELIALPGATFEGWVEIGGERFDVSGRPGAITHYWGRRLPDRWVWISATEFPDQPGRRVEASLAWTRTWGRGPAYRIGYVWTTDGERDDMTVSPVTGLARIERRSAPGDEPVTLTMSSLRPFGARHRLEVSAPMSSFNDLGEGIRQTLLADLSFDGVHAARGSVGFELRESTG
jgi:Tocopherol cyclase